MDYTTEREKMTNWNLTTTSPEESGDYIVALRHTLYDGSYSYGGPKTMMYSRKHDGWNLCDWFETAENRIEDLRDAGATSCVYAWLKPEPFTAETVAELEGRAE